MPFWAKTADRPAEWKSRDMTNLFSSTLNRGAGLSSRFEEKRIPGVAHWVGAINTRHRGKLYAAMKLVLTLNGGVI
jgi:hypothetical protein